MEIEMIVTDPRLLEFGMPAIQTEGSAGLDLRVMLPEELGNECVLGPGEQIMLDSGVRVWIKDKRYAGFLFPRSSSGIKGLVLANGTGVIDSDYQGPLKLALWNRTDGHIKFNHGDRVAQLVIMPVVSGYAITLVEGFSDATERGTGGFGSTGAK